MKKEYETVWEIFNECANNQMRDVFFDEIETDDPEAYIRQKFPDKNLKYEKTVEADGSLVFDRAFPRSRPRAPSYKYKSSLKPPLPRDRTHGVDQADGRGRPGLH